MHHPHQPTTSGRPMKSIRACIFDLFHTLVSLEVARTPGPGVPEILGVDRDRWWQIWTTDSDDYILGRRSLAEVLTKKARLANPAVTDEQIQTVLASRPKRFRHLLTHVEPETLSGLEQLTWLNLPLALVSNCGRDEVAAWDESPLKRFFNVVIFSFAVGLRKPDPAIYRLAARWLGVQPAECIYVGDGGSDEFAGARQTGMFTVLLTRHLKVVAPHRIPQAQAQADITVKTIRELVGFIRASTRE